jgi:hypothetical protein
MAITTFARIQHRRGIKTDLPTALYEGELGWCVDTRELFIGNAEPFGANTQILTEYSNNSSLITNFWQTDDITVQSAVARPLGSKLNDIASVKDFGAKGNGIDDDAPAINAAIQELFASSGSAQNLDRAKQVTVLLPAGVYTIKSPILLYPFVNMVGDGAGNTIILCDDPSMSWTMQTADSQGSTGFDIGTAGATIPQNITVRHITISTNALNIDCVSLDRYQNVGFDNVEFVGGYSTGDGGLNDGAGVRLRALAAAFPVTGARFSNCQFKNLTYGLLADDETQSTTVVASTFSTLWRGVSCAQTPVNNGPIYTSVVASTFVDTENFGIYYGGATYGVSSANNRFQNCGTLDGVDPIQWNLLSKGCSSIGDCFDVAQGVADYGTDNIIFNTAQTNAGVVSARRISFTKISTPGVDEVLYADSIRVPLEFPVDLQNSRVFCDIPPTANFTLTFQQNGTPFATATVLAGQKTATLVAASATSFAAGDLLEIVAPNPADATVGEITVDLVCNTN